MTVLTTEGRARQVEAVNRNRKKRLEMKRAYLRVHPCERCGEDDWRCLDLHHLDPAAKHRALVKNHPANGRKNHNGSWRLVPLRDMDSEFAKCEVLCANCHRKEHVDA